MGEIAGIFADENLEVVSAFPPNHVQAQILLGRGKFKIDPDGGETSWDIPGGLKKDVYDTRKEVANRLYLEVEDIDWVRVYLEPFERTSPLVAAPGGEPDLIVYDIYPTREDGVIELFASNDCYLKSAIEIATLADSPEEDPTDYDFRFHYKLLNSATLTAIERLGIDLPLPRRAGAAAQRLEATGKLRTLLGQTIRSEEKKIDWMSFLKGLVEALEELLNSSSGCNCLRGGGETRLFDLDYFTFTTIVEEVSKTAARPNQLPPGVRRASAP